MRSTLFFYKKFLIGICVLCPGIKATAQENSNTALGNRFAKYQRSVLTEKIFIHTDKTFYLAGDVIWFKIYCTAGLQNEKSRISSVSYVELLNKDQKPVMQAKVSIDKGTGNGYFSLPSSLPSGNYMIRGYTNWMKNFSPDFYYHLPITIVNTFANQSLPPVFHREALDFQFFPEGGNLVAGLRSRIGFKAVNEFGEAVNCSGIIVNEKADTIVRFETAHAGMGSFIFTPDKLHSYYAVLLLYDSVIRKELPEISSKGYVMSLSADSSNLEITVHATADFENLPVTLFAGTGQIIKEVVNGQIVHGETSFKISREKLDDGISHLTLFNAQHLPVCERLYFKCPITTMKIDVKMNQNSYGIRQRIDVDVTSLYASQIVEANLSMSVFLIDSLQSIPDQNIVTYLMLTSDLKGKIESPEYYLNAGNPGVAQATDNLMLTQGWRRFNWKTVLENEKEPVLSYLPEIEGHIVSGRIIDKHSGLPAKSVTGYISSPGLELLPLSD